jgi:multidrug efflux system outer membrane protein
MKRAAALLTLTALTACNMDPHYVRPTPAAPSRWPSGDAYQRADEAPLPSVSYRDIFRDPRLQQVIEQGLANNQDLRQAIANIQSARGLYRVQRAALFPTVDASAGDTISHESDQAVVANGGSAAGRTAGSHSSAYQLQVGTTAWEIDLFGRVRSLTRSALNQYLATEAAARATRLTLVANIADAWLTHAADRSLLLIAEDTEKSAQTSVDLTQARLNGGIAPRTDLRQAQTVLATAQADKARETTQVAQDINALQLLVGAPVADALLPKTIEDADGHLSELPAGLDSQILLRRPDVVEAEYQLRAANARIGAARAAFFPNISLTAVAGVASAGLSNLFTGSAFNWTVAPSATLPIFDWGANSANLAYAKAQRDVYLATYQKTIQTAFQEVANALARRGTIDAEVAADQLNVTAAQDTLTLDTARYREGIDPYLDTLDAQRTFYAARQTAVNIRLTKAQNLVALYQALGGDQVVDAMPPAVPAPPRRQ